MDVRPRLLDTFSKAGGATRGYQMAGFHVTGVDCEPQPRYVGNAFIQADALEFIEEHGHEFAAIHASPPCQDYSISRNNRARAHLAPVRLIAATRQALIATGKPYVIENVEGARSEMPSATRLCGAAFGLTIAGLDLSRHRLFETNWFIMAPPCCHTRGRTVGVYGHGTNSWHRAKIGRCLRIAEMRVGMGIDWMTRAELSQAIPPVYTQFVGTQLMAVLRHEHGEQD